MIARGKKDMAQYALDLFPELMYGADYPYCNTPLMYAINGLDLDMIKIFDKHPESYSIPNESGKLPLHMAVNTKDMQIIQHVYSKFPRALESASNNGQYPLHIACQHGCSSDIINFLYTEEQDVPDKFGNYPIHLFGEYISDDKYITYQEDDAYKTCQSGTISFLLKKNPNVLTKQNNSGNTPLHQLSMLFVPPKSVLFADISHALTPEVLHIRNNQGMFPLHIASFYHDIHLAIEMMTMCPEMIYEDSLSSRTIFDLWELASLKNTCSLVSHILSMNYPVREELWKYFPKPLQYFDKYLHLVRPEHLRRCIRDHLSKKARINLQDKILALSICICRNNMNIENELITLIVLQSM
jgi:hypothetical protein